MNGPRQGVAARRFGSPRRASREHADAVLNLGSELRTRPRPGGCRVFVNDVRAHIAPVSGYVDPDVTAVCGKPVVLDTKPRTRTNPNLIIEVLSPLTEGCDPGKKFQAYRATPSLTEYVPVDSRQVSVERYSRRGGFWVRAAAPELDDRLELSLVACTLTLRETYAEVQFPGTDEADDA